MLKVHQFSKGVVKWVYRIENKLLCLVSQYCYCYVLLDYAFFWKLKFCWLWRNINEKSTVSKVIVTLNLNDFLTIWKIVLHEYKINAFSYYRYAKKNEGGVGYYQHFRKDFIRPYGLAHNNHTFQDATLARRLKSINCKFMVRPHIAMSELSETMTKNWKYIGENIDIFDIDAIKKFLG